jgi:hypothetical protein
LVYAAAFAVAKDQNKALIGDKGITPARNFLDASQQREESKRKSREQWLKSSLFEGPVATEGRNLLFRLHNARIVRQIGLSISRNYMNQHWRERLWDRQDGMGQPVTTLLWLTKDRNKVNVWLDGVATCGICLSLLVLLIGSANAPSLLGIWVCQRSLMAVDGPWYGYGWEPQLAELGFHSLFLVPLLRLDHMCSPPRVLISTLSISVGKITP